MASLRYFLLSAGIAFFAIGSAMAEETPGEDKFLVIEYRPSIAPYRPGVDQNWMQMQEQYGQYDWMPRSEEVDASEVSAQMRSILATFSGLFSDMEAGMGVAVDEITLNMQVTAEGRVGLLGSGVTAGTSGGVQVVLRRPSAPIAIGSD
jgi:hypothetical protein